MHLGSGLEYLNSSTVLGDYSLCSGVSRPINCIIYYEGNIWVYY
jgi:hypothetical protein